MRLLVNLTASSIVDTKLYVSNLVEVSLCLSLYGNYEEESGE